MIALLLACAADEPPAPEETGATVTEPTPWDREDDPSTPDHTLAQIQAGFDAGLPALAAVDPRVLLQAYADGTARGTPECPGLYPAVGVTMAWAGRCTASDGWSYEGRGQGAWFGSAVVDGEPYAPYGELIATATIVAPGGATLLLDGSAHAFGRDDAGTGELAAAALGTFAFTGAGPDDWVAPSWLDAAPSVGLELTLRDDGATRAATLEGGLTHPEGLADGILGVRAEALAVADDGACDASGDLVLLGDAAQRYRLTLAPGGGCAPCGPVTRGETQLGEVCVDLAPLVAWTERPW